jgi:hypothetical protein
MSLLAVSATVIQYSVKFVKKIVPRDFLLQVYFMESSSPKPPIYQNSFISNFTKIRADIRSSRCTTGVVDTGGK